MDDCSTALFTWKSRRSGGGGKVGGRYYAGERASALPGWRLMDHVGLGSQGEGGGGGGDKNAAPQSCTTKTDIIWEPKPRCRECGLKSQEVRTKQKKKNRSFHSAFSGSIWESGGRRIWWKENDVGGIPGKKRRTVRWRDVKTQEISLEGLRDLGIVRIDP